jgi:2-polyprenyl-3-methyl-5-hydroxy-6-metoxy-1,4-benzoquinol methylase
VLVTDIVISQDVLEHVFDAPAVFREIARTLRPGGIHIFTVPTTSKQFPTFEAATRVDRGNGTFEVLLHAEPEVHGKPSLHPQQTHDFSAKIKELVSDPVVKENPELLKKNMITCNVELAQNSTRP